MVDITARVVEKSVSPEGIELTTFKLRYPKFIHGEFMTHRKISRNASSSRAIPTAKLISEVVHEATRAGFVWWGKNEPGMQANAELEGADLLAARAVWAEAAGAAAEFAERLIAIGTHKQLVNRLLEPFSHINVVATATDWANFFGLRLDKAAQPEMRALAEAMWAATNEVEARPLKPGQWHMPFVDEAEMGVNSLSVDIQTSVARCARVSYESFETGRRSTVEEDLKLYERLLDAQPLHASPAEHQATPDSFTESRWAWFGDRQPTANEIATKSPSTGADRWERIPMWLKPEEHGNFHGWRQYRKMIKGEERAPLPEGYSWRDGRDHR